MKRNLVIYLTAFCCLFFSGCSISEANSKMTLVDAVQSLQAVAVEWSPDAELVHMTSVDDPSINNDGDNGRRIAWTGVFHSSSQNKSIILSAKDGKTSVLATASEELSDEQFIKIGIASIDSDGALEFAQDKYLLQPGTIWALGYNYTL